MNASVNIHPDTGRYGGKHESLTLKAENLMDNVWTLKINVGKENGVVTIFASKDDIMKALIDCLVDATQ